MKKAGYGITAILAIAAFAVCLDLYAGIVVLKNGHSFTGQIAERNNLFTTISYKNGSLKISNRFIKEAIDVKNTSEYGRQIPVPSDEELLKLEPYFLDTKSSAESGKGIEILRTKEHSITDGKWTFSFKLPSEYSVSEKTETGLMLIRTDMPGTNIYAEVIPTPSVELSDQASLTEAAAKSTLPGFNTAYVKDDKEGESGTGYAVLFGTYNGAKGPKVLKTYLTRTASHTFILSFFVPFNTYNTQSEVFSLCRESFTLEETEK